MSAAIEMATGDDDSKSVEDLVRFWWNRALRIWLIGAVPSMVDSKVEHWFDRLDDGPALLRVITHIENDLRRPGARKRFLSDPICLIITGQAATRIGQDRLRNLVTLAGDHERVRVEICASTSATVR